MGRRRTHVAAGALLLLAGVNNVAGDWLELHAAERPRWRYSHGAAFLNSSTLIVTHGYNNRRPDGTPFPDWRFDTWALTATDKGAAWQELRPQGGPPAPRYGHAFVRLHTRVYMYGGDDGGAQKGSGSYVWGSYNNDVWVLESTCPGAQPGCDAEGWSWRRLPDPGAPRPRSMHSCVAVRVQQGGRGVEAMMCFGGLVLADGVTDGGDMLAGTVALRDDAEVWLMLPVAQASSPEGAVDDVRWIRLQPSNAATALARHGASMSYSARILPMSAGSNKICTEHSVWVFGGAATTCDVDGIQRAGISSSEYYSFARGNAALRGAANAATSCQLADTWRLVWAACNEIAADGELAAAWRLNNDAPVDAAAVGLGGLHWQHLHVDESPASDAGETLDPRLQATIVGWLRARGWDTDAAHPSPRSMAAMTATHFGALLHGGALCTPGCTCYTDAWRLLVAPAAAVSCALGLSGYLSCPRAITSKNNGVAWVAEAAAREPARSLSRVERIWAKAFAESNGDAPRGWPQTRYRQSLASDYRISWDAQLSAAFAPRADSIDSDTVRHFHSMSTAMDAARIPVLLFGGETYAPSTYFDDTWLWLSSAGARSPLAGVTHLLPATSRGRGGFLALSLLSIFLCMLWRRRMVADACAPYCCCIQAYTRLLCRLLGRDVRKQRRGLGS